LVTALVAALVTEWVTEPPAAGGSRGCPMHLKAPPQLKVAAMRMSPRQNLRLHCCPRSDYPVDRPLRRPGLSMAGTLVGAVVGAVVVPSPALRQSAVFHELQPPAGWWGIDR